MRKLAIYALAVWLAGTAASAGDADPALARLQGWLDGTKDLQARFEQTLLSSALGAGPRESGRVYLRRPGRMRWEYTDPDKIVLVLDDRTELYLAEEHRLHRAQLSADDMAMVALLAGTQPVASVFTPTLLPPERGRVRLKLVPRSPNSGMQEIVLALDPATSAVVGIETLDQGGNRMAYAFSDVKRNRGVGDAVFRFTPPKGTEVVDGL